MPHAYKTQLQLNLAQHYNRKDWLIKSNFAKRKDEILIIIPNSEDIKTIQNDLYTLLTSLPEIPYPGERTLISFCYPDGTGYCSKLINPNTQDEINLALLGQLPKRVLSTEEIEHLFY